MRIIFKNKKLQLLYTEEKGKRKYSEQVFEAFLDVVETIRGVKDERDLYALKYLHFEKLSGKKKEERSLILDYQFRLIVKIKQDKQGKYIEIIDIEDYH